MCRVGQLEIKEELNRSLGNWRICERGIELGREGM